MNLSNEKLNSVQALRAVAVLVVIYHHAILSSKSILGSSFGSSFPNLKEWGAIGVDLFFIISGFIMTRVAKSYTGEGKWKLFITKRVVRIIPLYWGLSVLVILVKVSQRLPIDLLEVGKTVYFFPFFETKGFVLPIVNVGWTLSFEIYFYLLIGIILSLNSKNVFYSLIVAIGLITSIGLFKNNDSVLIRFLTSSLLLEFGMGVVCGVLYDKIKPNKAYVYKLAWLLVILGSTIALSTIFWRYGDFTPSTILDDNKRAFYRSIIWGIPCAMILLGYVLLEKSNRIKIPYLIKLIGDASYSNYLTHMFILSIITRYRAKELITFMSPIANIYVLAQVVLCTLLSIVFYWYIEQPLTTFISNTILPNNRPAPKAVQA